MKKNNNLFKILTTIFATTTVVFLCLFISFSVTSATYKTQLENTYMKSFYSVMYCPSAVKVDVMGTTGLRLHHWIDWDKCTPKIISDKYKRGIA